MSRRRAGHAWTFMKYRGRYIGFIWSPVKHAFMTSGEAMGWPRCKRCRKPEEPELVHDGYCNTCRYYKVIPRGTFSSHEKDEYFPYNIGKEFMKSLRSSIVERPRRKRKVAGSNPAGGSKEREKQWKNVHIKP